MAWDAKALLREALDALAAVFFPAPCRICEKVLLTASRVPVCAECLASLAPLRGTLCARCGRLLLSPAAALLPEPHCQLCRRGAYDFDLARSFGAYDDTMVRAIVLLKYHSVKPLGAWFAERLAETIASAPDKFAADVVVPVPLHPSRQRERGYNQAELIARPLARRLGLPLKPYLLARTRPRPEKLKLTRRERWLSVRGAYAMGRTGRIDKMRVLLVDDVFTTGATLDACSRALRGAGAARVVGLTVARVVPQWIAAGGEAKNEEAANSI
jgi:ComF family protein